MPDPSSRKKSVTIQKMTNEHDADALADVSCLLQRVHVVDVAVCLRVEQSLPFTEAAPLRGVGG
jgi:hypothetical protein